MPWLLVPRRQRLHVVVQAHGNSIQHFVGEQLELVVVPGTGFAQVLFDDGFEFLDVLVSKLESTPTENS